MSKELNEMLERGIEQCIKVFDDNNTEEDLAIFNAIRYILEAMKSEEKEKTYMGAGERLSDPRDPHQSGTFLEEKEPEFGEHEWEIGNSMPLPEGETFQTFHIQNGKLLVLTDKAIHEIVEKEEGK